MPLSMKCLITRSFSIAIPIVFFDTLVFIRAAMRVFYENIDRVQNFEQESTVLISILALNYYR